MGLVGVIAWAKSSSVLEVSQDVILDVQLLEGSIDGGVVVGCKRQQREDCYIATTTTKRQKGKEVALDNEAKFIHPWNIYANKKITSQWATESIHHHQLQCLRKY